MKCNDCKTFKKADNCQACYIDLRSKAVDFLLQLRDLSGIYHLSTLDNIKKEIDKELKKVGRL
jgi:hypothetical protein